MHDIILYLDITTIPDVCHVTKVMNLRLDGNPVHCDYSLGDVMMAYHHGWVTLRNLVCASPPALNGVQWEKLTLSDLGSGWFCINMQSHH